MFENELLQKEQLLLSKNKEIKELKERVRELEQDMKDVAVTAIYRPTTSTTNNNTQNNILINLTPFELNKDNFTEKIQDHFDKTILLTV